MCVFCPDLEFNWKSITFFYLEATRTWRSHAMVNISNLLANGIQNRLNEVNDAALSVRIDMWYCHIMRLEEKCLYLWVASAYNWTVTPLHFSLWIVLTLFSGYSDVLWAYRVKWGLCLSSVFRLLASDTVTSCRRCRGRMVVLSRRSYPLFPTCAVMQWPVLFCAVIPRLTSSSKHHACQWANAGFTLSTPMTCLSVLP